MELTQADRDNYHVVPVQGDVDAVSAIDLDTTLKEAIDQDDRHLLVDCSNLNYISSPGIGVFTSRIEECEAKGMKIILYGMSEKVFRVFEILGLNELLPIVDTKEDAIKLLRDA